MNESKAVETKENGKSTIDYSPKTQDDLTIGLVRQFICKSATDLEAYMFIQLCKNQGLNPFLKDAYLIKFGNEPATQIVSKDAFLKRADTLMNYDGFDAGIIIVEEKEGKVWKPKGSFYQKDKYELVGGWCEVFRKDRSHPVRIEVMMDEYKRFKSDGKPMANWAKMEATMIRKVGVCQAHREAFPNTYSKMYIAEEFGINEDKIDQIENITDQNNNETIDAEIEGKSDKEIVNMDMSERYPKKPELLTQFVEALCKGFYVFAEHELKFDRDNAKDYARDLLGLAKDEQFSMKDIFKDPEMTKKLRIAIYKDSEKVLFDIKKD